MSQSMLDSRLLHKTVTYLIYKVEWLEVPNEWKHHDLGDKIDVKFIKNSIDNHFPNNDMFYFVNKRTNSKAYNKNEFENILKSYVGKTDFTIWNMELNKVAEFNKVGVMRFGILKKQVGL